MAWRALPNILQDAVQQCLKREKCGRFLQPSNLTLTPPALVFLQWGLSNNMTRTWIAELDIAPLEIAPFCKSSDEMPGDE